MIDPNKPIEHIILSACPNVELTFPRGQPEFPLATFKVIGNSSEVVLDGRERFSGLLIQIDIWDNSTTRERCEETACAVSDAMVAAGFIRTGADNIDEKHLYRKTMTFRGTVDTKTGMIYERS